jgi:IS30 family transposase
MIRVEVTTEAGARLTVEQRRTIERCCRIGLSQGQIASIIGKDKATVSRESQGLRLDDGPLRDQVWEWLRADWSPEQIAESLPIDFPDDPMMRVSHETIYQSLFVQTKGHPEGRVDRAPAHAADQAQNPDGWREAGDLGDH